MITCGWPEIKLIERQIWPQLTVVRMYWDPSHYYLLVTITLLYSCESSLVLYMSDPERQALLPLRVSLRRTTASTPLLNTTSPPRENGSRRSEYPSQAIRILWFGFCRFELYLIFGHFSDFPTCVLSVFKDMFSDESALLVYAFQIWIQAQKSQDREWQKG